MTGSEHDTQQGRPAPWLSVEMSARAVLEAIDMALTPIVIVLLKTAQDGGGEHEAIEVVLKRLVPLMDEVEDALGIVDEDEQ